MHVCPLSCGFLSVRRVPGRRSSCWESGGNSGAALTTALHSRLQAPLTSPVTAGLVFVSQLQIEKDFPSFTQ